MRPLAALIAAVLCASACAPSPESPSAGTSNAAPMASTVVNPARVERVRTDLPPGYEVAALTGRAAPLALWGFGPRWAAEPPECGVLADPSHDPATVRGWSGSGAGGIVYAVVMGGAEPPDEALRTPCAHWSVTAGHTGGAVTLIDTPVIDNTVTFGMATEAGTVVEGGTQTRSHADTFSAYFGGYVATVAVVTDPGAPHPPLDAAVAADLLVKTVSALRG